LWRNRRNFSCDFNRSIKIVTKLRGHHARMDLLARLAFAVAYLSLDVITLRGLAAYIYVHEGSADALFLANVAARLAVAIFLATFVAFALLRARPIAKARGLGPRLTAFCGAYMMILLPLFPAHEMPLPAALASAALVFLGDGLAIAVAWRLGRSISLMAEARRLVTSGPYALVRHPLYLAEEAAIIGTWLQFASPLTTALLILHAVCQLQRMRNEERVLGETFPEYAGYARTTARLIPGVY
jgi:protein-S-isoprenylcysteine O-methyltransferase Ste14